MEKEKIFNLLKNCLFGKNLEEIHYLEEDSFYDICDGLPEDFKHYVETGATKGVIIPSGCNFVIKIPFNGQTIDCEDEYGDYDTDFCEFSFSGADENLWDYCESELIKFKKIEKTPLERFFAKIECIGKIGIFPIYVQEKAEEFYSYRTCDDYSLEDRDEIRSTCSKNKYNCFNTTWLLDLENYCKSIKKISLFDDFMKFIKAESINDLHTGNIGYLKGVPVLFDYSGFHDC